MKSFVTFVALFLFNISGATETLLFGQVTQEWVAIYNGTGNLDDQAYSITVDDSGNAYVTGSSHGGATENDYLTIKYNSSGDTLWVRRYDNASVNGDDNARAIVVDDSGNVYVTGGSAGSGTGGDFVTIKYSPTGDEVWVQRWDSDFHQSDGARDIALDPFGNVLVSGLAYRGGNAWDCVTVKYDPAGVEQWASVYSGSLGDFDEGYALAVDNSGNSYVAGRCGANGSGDFLTIKYAPNGDTLWTRKYNGPSDGVDEAYAIDVDDMGNAYVTGRSLGSGTGYDFTTIKYDPFGDTLWVRRYNGTANDIDEAYSIALDNSYNVYVTGVSNRVGGTSLDYVTIKYNSSGDEQWVQSYNGPGDSYDYAYSIAVDDSGNVYVTGESQGGSPSYNDFATVKYNSSGVEQWVQRYNGPASNSDVGKSIVVDDAGNVYVTGQSVGIGTEWDYATIKYSQSTTGVYESESEEPQNYFLHQNYPNPFNPSTTILYSIPSVIASETKQSQLVTLTVYDVLGNEVATLVNEEKPAGSYEVTFDASQLSSGIYFYKLTAGSFIQTRKMLLLK